LTFYPHAFDSGPLAGKIRSNDDPETTGVPTRSPTSIIRSSFLVVSCHAWDMYLMLLTGQYRTSTPEMLHIRKGTTSGWARVPLTRRNGHQRFFRADYYPTESSGLAYLAKRGVIDDSATRCLLPEALELSQNDAHEAPGLPKQPFCSVQNPELRVSEV
jgi:hypothetical protein